MPWSSKSILKASEATDHVLEYSPIKFELGTPPQALQYLDAKKHGSDFRMSDVVAVQTGVEKMELDSYEERIEMRALEKLKEVQERAYQEGYGLGLDEGRKKAFEEHARRIEENLNEMSSVIQSLKNMKVDICQFNETHMVQLLFNMASKIAISHLEYDQKPVVEAIRQAVELAQGEENVIVHVSEKQLAFLEELQKKNSVEYDFIQKVKFVSNADISPGGCIIETNYGEVDSRVEQRVERLWDQLKDSLPRVKDKLVGSS
jgi:flagellar assembly protein FliH